jgi:hypothetical protein
MDEICLPCPQPIIDLRWSTPGADAELAQKPQQVGYLHPGYRNIEPGAVFLVTTSQYALQTRRRRL